MTRDLGDFIAANIRGLRTARGMLQRELADRLDVSRDVVTDLEAGTRRIDVDDLVRLCRALDCGFWDLMRGVPADVLHVLRIRPPASDTDRA